MSDYDSKKPTSWLAYLDATNLYGAAMMGYLPKSNFEWLTKEELQNLSIENIPDDSEWGYTLEVDLHYPDYLHEAHSDYPLCPETITPSDEMLSPYCKDLKEKFNCGQFHEKLIPHLGHRYKYKIYYSTLKLCLQLGMVITKIHRGIKYKQSPWLKSYIVYNTRKRMASTNSFEKDFFKLKNNAVYGKTMENVRKYQEVRIVITENPTKKIINRPAYERHAIFAEDCAAIHVRKRIANLNKPIYVGSVVLDVSKNIMYDFYYNVLKSKYGDNLTMCFTDTDSLLVRIQTEDIWKDFRSLANYLDISDYSEEHILFDCQEKNKLLDYKHENKKRPGTFSDEMNGEVLTEMVGLRSKMYSLQSISGVPKKRAKGVPKHIVKNSLSHDSYLECLRVRNRMSYRSNYIKSKNHQINTIRQKRIGLSPYDDKRYILDDGITTMAYGHYVLETKKALEFIVNSVSE
jgi:hypothetical protein